MGKTRFTALDTKSEVMFLVEKVTGCRVANVYDLGPRIYLIKLGGSDCKFFLYIESGSRIHCTRFEREKNAMPNGFATKLRKHIRGRKLDEVRQLGRDRVVILTFGTEERACHLIIELYDKGNIILTNFKYVILACLRPHDDIRVRNVFPLQASRIGPRTGRDNISASLLRRWDELNALEKEDPNATPAQNRKRKKAKNKKKRSTVLDWFIPMLQASPLMARSCLLQADTEFNLELQIKDVIDGDTINADYLAIFEQAWDIFEAYATEDREENPGYIVMKEQKKKAEEQVGIAKIKGPRRKEQKEVISIDAMTGTSVSALKSDPTKPASKVVEFDGKKATEKTEDVKIEKNSSVQEAEIELVYDNVVPFYPDYINDTLIKKFESFDEACDEFFSKIESTRLDQKASKVEKTALSKLARSQKQHADRVSDLDSSMEKNAFYARLLEENVEKVDECICATNDLLWQGEDWHRIALRIKEQKSIGNPVAEYIVDLDLHNDQIVLSLPYEEKEDEEEESDDSFTPKEVVFYRIKVNLNLTAMQNAGAYYAKRKHNRVKKEKTQAASSKAVKAANRKLKKDLESAEEVARIEKMRRIHWWEKFYWFISSDNYLILGGHDAQQNELLFKKYFDVQRDIYVHAQIHGASTVIIKNPSGEPIPSTTLNEAGWFCCCRSNAWRTKVPVQSYWVYGNQVSKTPNTGEYLPTGSFVIRGKKNFIPVQPLIMGLALLFFIDNDSYERNHKEDRMSHIDSLEALPCVPAASQTSTTSEISAPGSLESPSEIEEEEVEPLILKKELKQPEIKRKNMKPKVSGDDVDASHLMDDYIVERKKMLTKAEKKKLRKQKRKNKKNNAMSDLQSDSDSEQSSQKNRKKKNEEIEWARGKRSKMRKLKRKKGKYGKYFDEDDDEGMEIAQEMLGMKKMERETSKQRAMAAERERVETILRDNSDKKGKEISEYMQEKDDAQKVVENEEEERILAERKEVEQLLAEEDKEMATVRLAESITGQLNQLTGCPKADDVIFYAIPVCAPYCVLKNYTFKCKVQPGSTKRGKAIKSILHQFGTSGQYEHPHLLQYVKAVKDTGATNSFISDVKIAQLKQSKGGGKKGKNKGKGGKRRKR